MLFGCGMAKARPILGTLMMALQGREEECGPAASQSQQLCLPRDTCSVHPRRGTCRGASCSIGHHQAWVRETTGNRGSSKSKAEMPVAEAVIQDFPTHGR